MCRLVSLVLVLEVANGDNTSYSSKDSSQILTRTVYLNCDPFRSTGYLLGSQLSGKCLDCLAVSPCDGQYLCWFSSTEQPRLVFKILVVN